MQLPLAPELDFWQRAQLWSRLYDLAEEMGGAAPPGVELRAEAPEVGLRDPEAYRDELLARWVERARSLAQAVQAEEAPLALADCTPPEQIRQQVISFEAITLSLSFSCRLAVVPLAAARSADRRALLLSAQPP